MVEVLDFGAVSEEIAKMEKSLLPHMAYSGEISLRLGVEISPSEYSGLSYQELLNFYSRIKKIRQTSELVSAVGAKKYKEIKEAEVAMREISEEPSVLKITEKTRGTLEPEIKFERFEEEKPPRELIEKKESKEAEEWKPIPAVKKGLDEKIEFEVPAPDLKVLAEEEEHEEKAVSPIVFEAAVQEKKKKIEEKLGFEKEFGEVKIIPEIPKKILDIPYLTSPRHPELPSFPSIEQDPVKLGIKKYDELFAKMESSPKEVSVQEIKSQMLSLTKQLFMEKSSSEREKIKKEIIRLRNLLSGASKIKKIDLRMVLASLPEEFDSELLEYTTAMENLLFHALLEEEKEFYTALSSIPREDKENRKKAFEILSGAFSSLEKQILDFNEKTSRFLVTFHTSILEQIKQTASADEIKDCNNMISKITKEYCLKFSSGHTYLKEYMEMIKLRASHEAEVLSDETLRPLFEVLDLKEEQMLNYLQSKYQKKYESYLNKKMGKLEALSYARRMLLKEKGLSNELLSRYFHTSG